jgi:hypothetical protein
VKSALFAGSDEPLATFLPERQGQHEPANSSVLQNLSGVNHDHLRQFPHELGHGSFAEGARQASMLEKHHPIEKASRFPTRTLGKTRRNS